MQFDSQAQKAFVIECFKKYPCTIEEALRYINDYSAALTQGTIVVEAKDDKDRTTDSGTGVPEDNSKA